MVPFGFASLLVLPLVNILAFLRVLAETAEVGGNERGEVRNVSFTLLHQAV